MKKKTCVNCKDCGWNFGTGSVAMSVAGGTCSLQSLELYSFNWDVVARRAGRFRWLLWMRAWQGWKRGIIRLDTCRA